MEQNEWILRAVFNYGFPSVMLLILAYGAWRLIIMIIKNNKEREEAYLKIITTDLSSMATAFTTLAQVVADFRKANDEAHRYQREEHKDILDKIDNVKDNCNSK